MIYVKLPFRILCSLSSQLFDKFFVFSSFFSTPVRDNKNVIKLIIVLQILRFQQQLKSSWSMAKWYFKRSAPRTIWCGNPFTSKLSVWFWTSCSLHNLKRQLSIVALYPLWCYTHCDTPRAMSETRQINNILVNIMSLKSSQINPGFQCLIFPNPGVRGRSHIT